MCEDEGGSAPFPTNFLLTLLLPRMQRFETTHVPSVALLVLKSSFSKSSDYRASDQLDRFVIEYLFLSDLFHLRHYVI